ncbi:nuclease A inhibitor family protein [Staphylococcus auricularis]|uniref:Uncharacterized protein n=1 Tax=Staphylococcus auricularis TaxID=29379 RepID=A0ABX5IHX3_9STAP|nr:hypothetical protein [Staphylococcus auricularis]MCE5039215.1 hypothetical protein [Staphylococcus auricularis]MEB6570383.1 hypothetical protein [Staphylococcus auricularis]PTH19034.1 hypothetical protein BU607_03025 [Staphylococcus auricularis]
MEKENNKQTNEVNDENNQEQPSKSDYESEVIEKAEQRVAAKHAETSDDNKNPTDEEIEAELLQYLKEEKEIKEEEKAESKRFKIVTIILGIAIALIVIFRIGSQFM